ncbi:MAG: mannose-phosphate guanylyltransferase, partial [Solirubrobacteraceae bacterium]|nr:mannose-phosphate guanylyltransferase [Solirubrobacteraceae bacterium]
DLSAQIAQHEATGAVGTLALVPVDDPSSYGLVRLREDLSVQEFLEKPSDDAELDTNLISAGAYVLERSVLDLIVADQKVSIEREVWPQLVDNGLYGFADEQAYWIDIGTPARYLQVTFDILEGNVRTDVAQRLGEDFVDVDASAEVAGRVVPPAVVERGASIAAGAHVGSLAVLAEDVRIGAGSVVERSVVLRGARVGEGCVLRDCIVCPGAVIGDRTRVTDGAIVGEGVKIGADNVVARGARLFPGMEVPDGGLAF